MPSYSDLFTHFRASRLRGVYPSSNAFVDIHIITAHNYRMERNKHRTSFALDDATVGRIRRLARRQNVSQAEVVRQAVKHLAERSDRDATSVQERLRQYRASQRISAEEADAYLEEVAEDRSRWGRDK
jgi:hypothetical protein